MVHIKVQITPDSLIDPKDLAAAIAEALCPSLVNAVGISCILNKRKFIPNTNDSLPFKLTIDDRKTLKNLLPKLPPINGNMSQIEIDSFMEAYRQLENRPDWEPCLASAASHSKNLEVQEYQKKIHYETIKKAFSDGEIQGLTGNYVPTTNFGFNLFMNYAEASKYLKKCGFEIAPIPEHDFTQDQPVDEIHCDISTSAVETKPWIQTKPGVDKRWTAEKLAELAAHWAKHGTKKTAEHFGVSGTTVREHLKKYKKLKFEESTKKTASIKFSKRKKATPFSGLAPTR